MNSNFMVLILKSSNANTVDNFRPNILGNFLYKIISKLIADRVAKISSRIINLVLLKVGI